VDSPYKVITPPPQPPPIGLGHALQSTGNKSPVFTTNNEEKHMSKTRELMVQWLRDAHAMENAAIEILEKQASNLEHYPELQAKVSEHFEVTKEQEQMLRKLLERMDDGRSILKDTGGKLMGNMAVMTNMMAEDEVVKNCLADFAFENFEIASYKALIGAAEQAGEPDVKKVCERILEQEVEMANWLEQKLPGITANYLERKEAGEPAKR
jgi:ferritin-like metal-binding protein YciE